MQTRNCFLGQDFIQQCDYADDDQCHHKDTQHANANDGQCLQQCGGIDGEEELRDGSTDLNSNFVHNSLLLQ